MCFERTHCNVGKLFLEHYSSGHLHQMFSVRRFHTTQVYWALAVLPWRINSWCTTPQIKKTKKIHQNALGCTSGLMSLLNLGDCRLSTAKIAVCVVALNTTFITCNDPWLEVWVNLGLLTNIHTDTDTEHFLLGSHEIRNGHVSVVTKACVTQVLIEIRCYNLEYLGLGVKIYCLHLLHAQSLRFLTAPCISSQTNPTS